MRVKDAVGRFGEQVAERHLVAGGMTVLDRNWRCREGELDLVVQDGHTVAFVEVKTRSTLAFGHPAEAVTPRKAARIHRLAMRWIAQRQGEHGAVADIRFDIVSVVRLAPGGPAVLHVPGAF